MSRQTIPNRALLIASFVSSTFSHTVQPEATVNFAALLPSTKVFPRTSCACVDQLVHVRVVDNPRKFSLRNAIFLYTNLRRFSLTKVSVYAVYMYMHNVLHWNFSYLDTLGPEKKVSLLEERLSS